MNEKNGVKHLDAHSVKQAAQGQWVAIYAAANIDIAAINKHQPCPICGGTKPFRCDDKDGRGSWICTHCGAGDGFSLLQKVHNWSFPQALEFVAGVIGLSSFGSSLDKLTLKPPAKMKTTPTYTPDDPNPTAVDQMNRIRARATTDDGTIDKYLVLRGLNTGAVLPKFIRLAYQFEPDSKKTYPCMICPIRTVNGCVVGYHRTFLDKKTGGKAQIDNPKRFTSALFAGAYHGCSVWLGIPDSKLIICEGIETGLAIQQMSSERAVWCSLTTSLMKSVILPDYVHVVEVWSDNDSNQTGQEAAQLLHDRLKADGRLVKIVTPPEPNTDWLDVLQ